MVYCSNCGEKLPETANFCPKCGVKAFKNVETAAQPVSTELKDAFNKMSQELEKAFEIAAKEISAAFQTVSENIKSSLQRELLACPSCGAKNPSDAVFCHKCGKRIKSE
ncbi:MAG: zinc-ribbon domain-containing protein [Candidatus Bathyarchaeota archaeon]|nr:zinc-ribbon domain-containing protein [Candidatus Bathyarchaeota archaeon]